MLYRVKVIAFASLMMLGALTQAIAADISMIDRAMRLTHPDYQINNHTISQPIQVFSLLSHELTLASSAKQAETIAKTLIALSNTRYQGQYLYPSNPDEKKLMIASLHQAAWFLREMEIFPEADLISLINTLGASASGDAYIPLTFISSVLLATYHKYAHPYKPLIDMKESLVYGVTVDWLKQNLEQDRTWSDLDAYWQNPSLSICNAVSSRDLEKLRQAATRQPVPPLTTLLQSSDPVTQLSTTLSETGDKQRAFEAATLLQNYLQNHTNFYGLWQTTSQSNQDYNRLVPALIRVEKYRWFETEQGTLQTRDPSILDYQPSQQTPEGQAVLLCLVSAIQNSLSNPKATPADLLRLLSYQKNSRSLSAPVKTAIQGMLDSGRMDTLINEILIALIQQTPLTIYKAQKLVLDQQAQKRPLLSYSMPMLQPDTDQKMMAPALLRHFGSSGAGLQCGFFSLGFDSRQQAIQQILDNLVDAEIYLLANKISGESAEIQAAMLNYFETNILTANITKYLQLYAKNQGVDGSKPDFLAQFKDKYCHLLSQITAAEKAIDQEFENLKTCYNLPATVPVTDDGTIANQISLLRQPFEQRKWGEQAKLTKFFYRLSDFQDLIAHSIQQKFAVGELEFDPNPIWQMDAITYPKLLAILNNWDIYAWVSTYTFHGMQRQRQASKTNPIHVTHDNAYVLVNYTHGGNHAKPIDVLNLSGFHYEKWIRTDDYGRLAKAIRHNHQYFNR